MRSVRVFYLSRDPARAKGEIELSRGVLSASEDTSLPDDLTHYVGFSARYRLHDSCLKGSGGGSLLSPDRLRRSSGVTGSLGIRLQRGDYFGSKSLRPKMVYGPTCPIYMRGTSVSYHYVTLLPSRDANSRLSHI